MRAIATIAAVMLCACSSPGTVASATPSAVPPGSSAIWTVASPPRLVLPSPVEVLPVVSPGFTCHLPVDAVAGGTVLRGGFETVPGGKFEPDPNAGLVDVSAQSIQYQTTVRPVLTGSHGLGYDPQQLRWVPAYAEAFSPDGSEYAWTELDMNANRLHVTNVADGNDRSWSVKNALQRWPIPTPLGFSGSSVLLTYGWEGTFGVWRLDTTSGALARLSTEPAERGYGAGAIWLVPLRGSTSVGAEQSGDTLSRLDLSTGTVVDWFHRDGTRVEYVGVDGSGSPWVWTADREALWRVRGPGAADLVLTGHAVFRIFADRHGTWFGDTSGVYLYSGGKLKRVSEGGVGEVLGPCID